MRSRVKEDRGVWCRGVSVRAARLLPRCSLQCWNVGVISENAQRPTDACVRVAHYTSLLQGRAVPGLAHASIVQDSESSLMRASDVICVPPLHYCPWPVLSHLICPNRQFWYCSRPGPRCAEHQVSADVPVALKWAAHPFCRVELLLDVPGPIDCDMKRTD